MIENHFGRELHQARAADLHSQAEIERRANAVRRAAAGDGPAWFERITEWCARAVVAPVRLARRRVIGSLRSWLP